MGSPLPSECGGGVLNWRRHWLVPKFFLIAVDASTALWGVERVGGVGGWVEQASCWVLKQQTTCCGVCCFWQSLTVHQTSSKIFWVLVVGVGWGFAGCLRITQWTRASLWSSC